MDKKNLAINLIDQLIEFEKIKDIEYKKLLYDQKGEMIGQGDNITIHHLNIVKELIQEI
jgi:hypothetical protein